VPAFVWGACDDASAACEQLVNDWEQDADGSPRHTLHSVLREGDDFRYGMTVAWTASGIRRAAVAYGPGGVPVFAWRKTGMCSFSRPLVQADGVWFGAQGDVAQYIYQPYAAGASPHLLTTQTKSQDQKASANLLAIEATGSGMIVVEGVDLPAEKTPAGSTKNLRGAYDDFVTYIDYKDVDSLEGWVWRKGAGYMRMVAPSNRIVRAFVSDGQTFYWVEIDDLYEPTFAELWTSPVVADANQLAPQKRADLVSFGGAEAAGDGHFAYVDYDLGVHVYRLSDGKSWTFAMPNGDQPELVPYLDSSFVILQSAYDVYRIRFNELPPD